MIVSIHQPNILPHLDYFKKLKESDIHIFLDCVEFSKQSYTQRVKLPSGWITIPVHKHSNDLRIADVKLKMDEKDINKILNKIQNDYQDSPHFNPLFEQLVDMFTHAPPSLSRLNFHLINLICKILDIDYLYKFSSRMTTYGHKTMRLLRLLKQVNATEYLCGIGSHNSYLDKPLLEKHGITCNLLHSTAQPYSVIHNIFTEGVDRVKERLEGYD